MVGAIISPWTECITFICYAHLQPKGLNGKTDATDIQGAIVAKITFSPPVCG